jgi:chitin synthase
VNRFVKLLVATIDEAASLVHETEIHVKPPKKYPTPYGGRLVWTLPGKTKMIAHLKDKGKIRHRKRWSQVRLTRILTMYIPTNIHLKKVAGSSPDEVDTFFFFNLRNEYQKRKNDVSGEKNEAGAWG